ncbi:DMT family transporter [Paralcaligenes sp. KSB-10]|uniref:DMT family transporter n=1 Tax=Paralcaligenes sp. KSB-10 TaxID=2901142 RepID=UPI001E5D49F4|nr:DMT family transporter [Paralcaligenes sp. KSB-10]UHL64393.1 DMT family transporter [Paralcaligenes sp. KSB-10]
MKSTDDIPSWTTYLLLAITVFAWGANYPLMKLALSDMPPLAFTALRLWGASAVLAAVLLVSRTGPLLPIRGERLPLAIVGLFQVGAMLGLTIVGMGSVPAGRTVLLVYTMSLWAVPIGRALLGEKINFLRLLGVLIGLMGLLVFFNPLVIDWHRGGAVLGSGLILAGSMSWAFGSCLYRRKRWSSGFVSQTLWQLLVASVPIAVLSLVLERTEAMNITARLSLIVAYNWVVPTALAMWCWNRVLSVMAVSTAGQFLLLTPLVGFWLSIVFLNETMSRALIVSAILIMIGLFVTIRAETPHQDKKHRP